MESDQVVKIYDKLIEISTDVGQIKADMTTAKDDIKKTLEHSDAMDKAFEEKLEKYFSAAKDGQDKLRDDMEIRISGLETRITNLEEKRGRRLLGWVDKTRDWAIWAIIVALFSTLAVLVKQFAKSLWDFMHMLPPQN